MSASITVASANFSAQRVGNAQEFWQKIEAVCAKAKAESVEVLLLPEYFILPLVVATYQEVPFKQKIAAFAKTSFANAQVQLQKLADQYNIALIAGSMPALHEDQVVNRCLVLRPNVTAQFQDKIHMTRFEVEDWQVSSGVPELRIFNIKGFRCLINICYDVEFAHLAHLACEANMHIIFVPSCTDTAHGYWRVRNCAQARAVEFQSYVLMASLVDGIPEYPDMDTHYGRAAILSPCDGAFPATGVLKEAADQSHGFVVQKLNLQTLLDTRANGSVFNFRHHAEIRYPKNFAGLNVVSE